MWSAEHDLDVEAVDLDDLLDLPRAGQRAGHRDLGAVGHGAAQVTQVAVVGRSASVLSRTSTPRSCGEQRRVDVGHRLLDDVGEHPLEGGQLEHPDVVRGDLAAHLDVELGGTPPASAVKNRPSFSASGMPGRTSSAIDAALDVDRVGDQLAGQGQPHRPGDRDAGLLLRLVGAGAQVRRGDDRVELEQRRVGARLLGVDVEAGAGDPALLEGGVRARPRRRSRRGRR